MHIDAGEVVSCWDAMASGAPTTVKAIMGEVPPQGSIKFKGNDIVGFTELHGSRIWGWATFRSIAISSLA